jgi:predicted nucleic acid-binding protein
MILVDTSVWIDHLKTGDDNLGRLLEAGRVLMHPFVLGELALGSLRNRQAILELLGQLPRAEMAMDQEVLSLIEAETLHGTGIGLIDAHRLASAKLTAGSFLWTRVKRLERLAARLHVSTELE